MTIPDPIERIEARIDELCDAQFAGVPLGMIRCYGCKQVVSVNDVNTASADPDSPAYCFGCLGGDPMDAILPTGGRS